MSELLGKGDGRTTLLQHTFDVMDACESLFGTADQPTRLGLSWLRFFRVSKEQFRAFHINLLTAAAAHDWGKANDGMQNVLSKRPGKQVIRHEHLSGLLLDLESVVDWLKQRQEPSIDQDIVLAAVISHHLKAKLETFASPPRAGMSFRVECNQDDFRLMLERTAKRLGLPQQLPLFTKDRHWGYRDEKGNLPAQCVDVDDLVNRLKDRRLAPFKKIVRRDEQEPRRRMLWTVRAALIAGDAAGSGLVRQRHKVTDWIEQNITHRATLTKQTIWDDVISKRVDEVKRANKWHDKGDGKEGWNDFQLACDKLPHRALLLAPCGSGKTLAAWRWIAAQMAERPAGRVIFLYPTRATAKEGFRDYVSWAPECDAALMHGTSAYDLEGMFPNSDDPNDPHDPREQSHFEVDRRLYAMGYWSRRIFSATADQFLAFMKYAYGPVCMLPVLTDSVLVIDEVHSFDRSMISVLKDFLKTFDLPVLCMTATLRQEQQEQLENECGLTVYNDKPGELNEIASAMRYRVQRTTDDNALDLVRQAIADKKRVLWVVNQVKRAQRAFLDCYRLKLSVPVFCYHSRFRLMDRRDRHDEVVKAFRSDSPPAVAVTTQVCEMSLDMDADVLITECCPTTSLIQRMGRCNRDRRCREGAGTIWVYQPCDDAGKPDLNPYDDDSLTGVPEFLAKLALGNGVSQIDLEQALAEAPQPPARDDELSSFLKSGPYAMGHEESFREIENFTVSAVLAKDVEEFLALQQDKRPTDGFVVPVPRWLGREPDGRLPSYVAVAKTEHYHPLIGFCDKPELIAELGGLP